MGACRGADLPFFEHPGVKQFVIDAERRQLTAVLGPVPARHRVLCWILGLPRLLRRLRSLKETRYLMLEHAMAALQMHHMARIGDDHVLLIWVWQLLEEG